MHFALALVAMLPFGGPSIVQTDPPCAAGVTPAATIQAEDREDRGGSLTASHAIGLELLIAGEPDPQTEFDVSVPPGVTTRWAGSPTVRADAAGPLPVTATWTHYPPGGDPCSASVQTTLNIEPATPPRYIAPRRNRGYTTQFEWRLRWGKNADLRPVELRVRGVRRARLPSASAPARKLTFSLRGGDKGAFYFAGRERSVRTAGWKFSVGSLFDKPRILMHGAGRRRGFGIDLQLVQGGRQIGRTRIVGRCDSLACHYRTVAPH